MVTRSRVQASVVAEVPMRWPPAPPPQARTVAAATPQLAPLLTRSAASAYRRAAAMLRSTASPLANGSSHPASSPGSASPNGAYDVSPSAAAMTAAVQHAERKVVWLSALQWVTAAGAGAVPTDATDGQLRRLLHDLLACAPQKGGLGMVPRLPLWNGRGAAHACSLELYILRQCACPTSHHLPNYSYSPRLGSSSLMPPPHTRSTTV